MSEIGRIRCIKPLDKPLLGLIYSVDTDSGLCIFCGREVRRVRPPREDHVGVTFTCRRHANMIVKGKGNWKFEVTPDIADNGPIQSVVEGTEWG